MISKINHILTFCFSFKKVSDCIWQSDDETNLDSLESQSNSDHAEQPEAAQNLDPVDMDIESDKENKEESEDVKVIFLSFSHCWQFKRLFKI